VADFDALLARADEMAPPNVERMWDDPTLDLVEELAAALRSLADSPPKVLGRGTVEGGRVSLDSRIAAPLGTRVQIVAADHG